MAKGTHSGGASFTEHELSDPVVPDGHQETFRIQRAALGGEPLAGTDSSQSSKEELPSNDSETASLPSLAQTTENPSGPTENPEASTARSTATSGRKGTASRSGSGKARVRAIPDADEFD